MTPLGEALERLPKVELHCHVEGTMRPQTVVELARRNNVALPTADPAELYRYHSLDSFLAVFWLVQSTLGGRDDWARLAYESIVDGAAHGVVHRESFFSPLVIWRPARILPKSSPASMTGSAAAEARDRCQRISDRRHGPGTSGRRPARSWSSS